MDSIVSLDLRRPIVEQLILFITRSNSSNASSVERSLADRAELDALNGAATAQLVYLIGKKERQIKKRIKTIRRVLMMMFLEIRESSSKTKIADMNILIDSLAEVGFVTEILDAFFCWGGGGGGGESSVRQIRSLSCGNILRI